MLLHTACRPVSRNLLTVKLQPIQMLIPDGIFANSFGSLTRPHWEPGVALALCMACNNAAAAAQKALPDMFIATARVPLALDVQESCREAQRAVKELGIKIIVLTPCTG